MASTPVGPISPDADKAFARWEEERLAKQAADHRAHPATPHPLLEHLVRVTGGDQSPIAVARRQLRSRGYWQQALLTTQNAYGEPLAEEIWSLLVSEKDSGWSVWCNDHGWEPYCVPFYGMLCGDAISEGAWPYHQQLTRQDRRRSNPGADTLGIVELRGLEADHHDTQDSSRSWYITTGLIPQNGGRGAERPTRGDTTIYHLYPRREKKGDSVVRWARVPAGAYYLGVDRYAGDNAPYPGQAYYGGYDLVVEPGKTTVVRPKSGGGLEVLPAGSLGTLVERHGRRIAIGGVIVAGLGIGGIVLHRVLRGS